MKAIFAIMDGFAEAVGWVVITGVFCSAITGTLEVNVAPFTMILLVFMSIVCILGRLKERGMKNGK